MKLFKIEFWLVSMFLFTNCSSKIIIEKTIKCSNLKKEEFSDVEILEIEKILNIKLNPKSYKLNNKGTYLECKTRSKKNKDIYFSENFINKPDLIFKKISIDKKTSEIKVEKVLRQLEIFKYVEEEEKINYKLGIIGYVENENDLIDVNMKLESQNISLSQENMYWLSNSGYLKSKDTNRRYLIGTNENEEIKMTNILNFTENLKAYIDPENFEPAIKLFLNECGLNECKKFFKKETQQINIYTVIIDNRINSIQKIRIRNNNEISLFGFKTLDKAISVVKILEKENLSLKIK